MCHLLGISRSTYYYEVSKEVAQPTEDPITSYIVQIFKDSYSNYGTRKIKVELYKIGFQVSRRRIGRIMKEQGLISNYTVAQYKVHKDSCNEDPIKNELERKFKQDEPLAAVVSDLTYVRVNGKWHYLCILLDLYNREIIGYSAGPKKDAHLVHQAFASVQVNLNKIQIFHTDRGSEFKNGMIAEIVKVFQMKRSLSMKACPYDNAVAEATFKIIKTEFVYPREFESLAQLKQEWFLYVWWFNHKRIHSTLGYLSPIEYKNVTP